MLARDRFLVSLTACCFRFNAQNQENLNSILRLTSYKTISTSSGNFSKHMDFFRSCLSHFNHFERAFVFARSYQQTRYIFSRKEAEFN